MSRQGEGSVRGDGADRRRQRDAGGHENVGRRRQRDAGGHDKSAQLGQDAIVDAALALIDEGGLDALSMRKLADRLGVGAMSLYHYFPSREALVDACCHRVIATSLGAGDADGERETSADWRGVLRSFVDAVCRAGHGHPALFARVAAMGFEDPVAAASTEVVLASLIGAGLTPRDAFTAFSAVRNYVFGAMGWEIAAQYRWTGGAGRPSPDPADLARLPSVAAAWTALLAEGKDIELYRGLDVVLDGIAARLESR